jgi:hypothetical protein
VVCIFAGLLRRYYIGHLSNRRNSVSRVAKSRLVLRKFGSRGGHSTRHTRARESNGTTLNAIKSKTPTAAAIVCASGLTTASLTVLSLQSCVEERE